MPKTKFSSIAARDLHRVNGGASRVSSRSDSNAQVTQMLTQVTSSIKDLANNKSSGMDPMMMMMMMMMGGGGGGGGGAVAAAPAAPPPEPPKPVISISSSIKG